jgi:hypothetical protein
MPAVVRLDMAKRVFQAHPVEPEPGEIIKRGLRDQELKTQLRPLPRAQSASAASRAGRHGHERPGLF